MNSMAERMCLAYERDTEGEWRQLFFGPESHCVLASRPVYTDPRIEWLVNID
jgi:hypothetical protein